MKLADLIRDALGMLGAGLIACGAGLVYLPAGLIVGGMLLLGGAWLSARSR
jgi:hypothetical protein